MTPAYQPTRNGAPAMSRTVIVLAAGEGKRMKSALPKVLHPLLGRTLLGHVLAATAPLAAARTLVVVDNGQGEEYLTDVVGLLVAAGQPVGTHRTDDPDEALGVNDRVQLAQLRALLRDRINEDWMRAGVSIVDPATVWIDVTVTLERDVVVEPNTQLRGATTVGEGALVGPDTTLTDVAVGPRAAVVRAHGSASRIGAGASVGPYAYLRPGTVLGEAGKIGTFVETKNAQIGAGTDPGAGGGGAAGGGGEAADQPQPGDTASE